MKRLRIQWVFAAFLTIISLSSHANTSLNGSSGYQDLGNDVFVASLYLESPKKSADAILAANEEMKLQVVLTNRMSKRRWVNMWMQSMAINNPRDSFEAQANNLVDLFDTFKGSLIANDTFEIHYLPGTGTTVSLNSVALSQQPNIDLLFIFLRAWIGSVPPSTQFKAQILGQEDSSAIAASVVGLTPSQQRIDTVTQWTISEEEKLAEEKRLKEEQEAKEREAKEKELLAQQAAAEEKAKAEAEAAKARAEAQAAQAELAAAEEAAAEEAAEENVELSVESLLAQQEYTTNAARKIYSNIRYPKNAVKRNQQGTVRLEITVARDGSINSSEVLQPSGYGLLDKAALSAASNAAPFDAIPEVIKEEPLLLVVPIAFKLTN